MLPLPEAVCPICEIFPLSAADKLKDGVCVDCRHKRKRQEERESVCISFSFLLCFLLPLQIATIKYQTKQQEFEQRKIQLQENALRKLQKERTKTWLADKKYHENAQIISAELDHINIKHKNLPNINITIYKPKQHICFSPY